MARDIPIGNGTMLVCFDETYQIRDWYYPLVGQENHTAGHPFHLGVWANGEFSWVNSDCWTRHLDYEDHTLATRVTLEHPGWGLTLRVTDVVDFHDNLLIRRFHCENHSSQELAVKIFFHHDFHVYGVDVGDTAFYDPMSEALIHYKDRRYFLMSGQVDTHIGIHSWATGRKEVEGMEGTWRDAEDGHLEAGAITQGSVDSTYSLNLTVSPGQTGTLYAWVAAGTSLEEVRALNGLVTFETPEALIVRTQAFWSLWLSRRSAHSAHGHAFSSLYDRSLLIVRTNIDNHGGIVAANDSDIMHHSRDTYSYVWPRDGAWVARALDEAGYSGLSGRFFEFMADVIDPGGYFLHKYNPDGSLASSWHPWIFNGRPELPIQEDETGGVLWALWQHFLIWRDVEQVEPWLSRLIFPAGQFLADYRHPTWKLPWPSWDLWEERRGIHAYTVASVFAGLTAAGHFAAAFGDAGRAETFYHAAHEVQNAARQYLVDEPNQRLIRRIEVDQSTGTDVMSPDHTADASLLLVPQFGLIAPDDPLMVNTANWVHDCLSVPGAIGGLARYENDLYQQAQPDPKIPGNPWFVCTLWYAEYLLMRAKSADDLVEPARIITWVGQHALASGILAEQLNPHTGRPLSVSPLTWSHSTLILTIERYRRALDQWNTTNQPAPDPAQLKSLYPIGY